MSANLATRPTVRVLTVRMLAGAFGVMVALLPARGAEPPVPVGQPKPAQIEIFHGSRRVDQKKDKQPESQAASPTPAPEIITANRSDRAATASSWPSVSGQGLPIVHWPATGLFGVQSVPAPKILFPIRSDTSTGAGDVEMPDQDGPEIVKGTKPVPRRAKATTKKKATEQPQIDDSGEDQEEPAVTPANRGQRRPAERSSDMAAQDGLSNPLIQIAFIFAVAIVAPVVSILCFFGLLRRHSKRFGPLFRIDYVGNQPVVTGPFTASALGLAGQQAPDGSRFQELQAPVEDAAAVPEHMPERFELGPTFEEERLLKQEQAKQQEDAVLQHLFEENLRLQEQIGQAIEKDEEL